MSTDTAAALAPTDHLTPFDGRDVLRTTIAVANAGDGLSEALRIDPREFHHGEIVHVVLECVVDQVRFVPLDTKDAAGPLVRTHRLKAGTATIVDADLVAEQVNRQKIRIEKAREEAAGVTRIKGLEPDGWDDDEIEALVAEHLDGHHGTLQDGCPECEAEKDAEAAEAEDGP